MPVTRLPVLTFALTLAVAAVVGPAAARADRCDDLARDLKSTIDGLSVGRTAANVIYLSHPAAKQIRLGCTSRAYSNEVFAESAMRKPSPAFMDLVASAAAIAFTIPKRDTLRGANRCIGRLGLLRGNDIKTRFRRLDIRCARTKTTASIAISRGRDE